MEMLGTVAKLILVLYIKVPSMFAENVSSAIIIDVIRSSSQPTSVTAFLCSTFESLQLIKDLSQHSITASVYFPSKEPLSYPFPSNHALFVADLSCNGSLELLIKADKLKLFAAPFRWLLINNQQNNATEQTNFITTYFSSINVLVDSDVMITNYESPSSCTLIKIYRIRSNLPLLVENIGFWNLEDGCVLQVQNITSRRRRNLMETVLKTCIVITHNDSLNHLTDRRDRHIDTIAKVNYFLVEHLSNIVNASLKYSVKTTWGYKDNNSQWSGMIGELQRHEADIGGTGLFLMADRVPVIDYIAMTTPTRSKFVFRQPKLSYVANVYTLPFHWSVWICSFALIIVLVIGLYGVLKWEWAKKKYTKVAKELKETELQASWIEVTMLAFGAMCQQGASSLPFGVPGRIITILMFISLMFLYTSYSANIVALLQSSSHSIQTLSDLLHSRLDVGVDDTVFNRFYFPNATEPVRRAIYLQKVIPPKQAPRYFPIAEGVKKMRDGLFAFHMETGAGYKIVIETFEEHEKCGLQEIQFLQVSDPWLAVQKNTSYREMLKIGLHQIQESGIQSREVSLLYTKKPPCTNRESSFVSVGIIDCYLAAAVLFCGMILSLALFVLEVLISYRLEKYRERQSFVEAVVFVDDY